MSSSTAVRSASLQATNRLSNRSSHSRSSHARPPRIATCRAGWSIIMKSMNSGTPASVALPDRSSRGMMRSTSSAHGLALVRREELRLERRALRRRGLRAPAPLAGRRRLGLGPRKAGRQRRGSQREQPMSAGGRSSDSGDCHMLPPFRCSAMYSLVRIASARIVHVGFLSGCETNGPPSATNRFFTSCAWQYLLSADDSDRCPCA